MSSGTWGEIKTSYRVVGEPDVDEFAGLCAALGLRPHQLVRRLVTEGIARYRDDPDVDQVVRLVCEGRRQKRGSDETAGLNGGHVIDARDRFRGPVREHPCSECGDEGNRPRGVPEARRQAGGSDLPPLRAARAGGCRSVKGSHE
jgi:hypothetical protein